jgi:hypothetical protein
MDDSTLKPISEPTRGQPVDSKFLFDVAQAINNIIKKIGAARGSAYIKGSANDTSSGKINVSDALFFASIQAVTPQSVNIGQSISQKIDLSNAGFQKTPVVSITPIITDTTNNDVAKSATVVVDSLSTTECNVSVRFGTSGDLKNLSLHIIAIGVPVAG